MAHPQQLMFFKIFVELFLDSDKQKYKVLEVGSFDITGTIRQFFIECEYTGCDLTEGPGVDVVSSGHDLNHPSDFYDITVSSECFEHNPLWIETFQNMWRMTKPGGLMVITCASRGRVEHGTARTTIGQSVSPGTAAIGWDYYRNLNKIDFEKNLPLKQLFTEYFLHYMPTSCDLYFCGQKKGPQLFKFSSKKLLEKMPIIRLITGNQDPSRIRAVAMKIHTFPIYIMSYILNDVDFQNWRIKYLNTIRPFANFAKKLMRQ